MVELVAFSFPETNNKNEKLRFKDTYVWMYDAELYIYLCSSEKHWRSF